MLYFHNPLRHRSVRDPLPVIRKRAVILPHMHRKYVIRIRVLQEIIHAVKLVLHQPRICRHKRQMNLPAGNAVEYIGTLTGQKVSVEGGHINVRVGANSGEIWVPTEDTSVPETFSENKDSIVEETPVTQEEVKNEGSAETKTASASSVPEAASTKEDTDRTPASAEKEPVNFDSNKAPEDMSIEELQAGILAKMATNGSVTDQMKKTVYDNIWHDSLVNWIKSFR